MTTINILWIEDNPLIEKFDFEDNIKVPYFGLSGHKEGKFRFNIMQHPVEVFEYLRMISILKENRQAIETVNPADCLFDLVVFDYKLFDNLNTTGGESLQYSFDKHLELIKKYSPSFRLKNQYKDLFPDFPLFMERTDVLDGNYSSAEFFRTAEMDGANAMDDEFGLYCGLTLLRELKDIPVLGIPATLSKASRKNMSHNSQFYEWLNSFDLKSPISRSNQQSKNWDEILDFALSRFRIKIQDYINTDRVSVIQSEINQLIKLVGEGVTKDIEFRYYGNFGVKELDLDGLFSDINNSEERKSEMLIWLRSINEYFAKTEKVKGIFDTLWNDYHQHFGTRITISNYTLHPPDPERDPEGLKRYADLKSQYIDRGEIKEEVRKSFDELVKDPSRDIAASRLLILMICTKLFIEHQHSILQNPINMETGQINLALEEDDYYNALYPFTNSNSSGDYNPLLLMMHKAHTPTSYYANFYNRLEKLGIPKNKKWLMIAEWIKPKEKNILKSYFRKDLEEILPPEWLK